MEHLSEVIMIIKGGWSGDQETIKSYVERLATKFDSDGKHEKADMLRHVLAALQRRQDESNKEK